MSKTSSVNDSVQSEDAPISILNAILVTLMAYLDSCEQRHGISIQPRRVEEWSSSIDVIFKGYRVVICNDDHLTNTPEEFVIRRSSGIKRIVEVGNLIAEKYINAAQADKEVSHE